MTAFFELKDRLRAGSYISIHRGVKPLLHFGGADDTEVVPPGLMDARWHINVTHMKTTTMRELKHETSKVLGWAEAGEEVTLTRRGKTIALLSPPRATRKPARPDFAARLRSIYGDTVLGESATALINDARGDR